MENIRESVDVEKIMNDIRAQIEKEGLVDDLPSFSKVNINMPENMEKYQPSEDIREEIARLKECAEYANWNKFIGTTYPVTEASPVKRMIKKVLNHLSRPSMRPVTERITQENVYLSKSISILTGIVEKQQEIIERLEKEAESKTREEER